MNYHQSFFEVWNYTFLFMSLSTLVVFIVDMLGHRSKTISSNVFSLSVVFGVVAGELCVSFVPVESLAFRLGVALVLCTCVSVWIPRTFRTSDPVVKTRLRG